MVHRISRPCSSRLLVGSIRSKIEVIVLEVENRQVKLWLYQARPFAPRCILILVLLIKQAKRGLTAELGTLRQ